MKDIEMEDGWHVFYLDDVANFKLTYSLSSEQQ
jgi:hypothetical protein